MPITQSGGALLVSGATTVDAGTGAISLLQVGNNFNSVSLTGNGIGVTDGDNLSLAALTSTGHGAVVVTAAGTLSLPSQTLTVGNSNLTLASNGGALSTAADLGGNNVTLFGRDGLTLGHGVTANTLALSSTNAAIVQNTGALGVVGASTVDAGSAGIVLNSGSNRFGAGISLTGTGMIVLDATGNDFQGTVHARGSSIAIVDRNDLAATAQASDALRLQAGGQLTTAGTLSANTIALRGGTGVVLGHDVAAASVALSGGGAITQNAGSLRAGQLSVNAAGAVMLTGSGNAIDTLGDFSAQGLDLVSNRSLLVSGRVDGGPSLRLRSGGDLQLSGQLSGAASWLQAVAGIRQRAGSSITSGLLSGGAGGAVVLGDAAGFIDNRVVRLSDFTASDGFSFTNGGDLLRVLANGGSYSVDAGNSAMFLSVRGNLSQDGRAPLRNAPAPLPPPARSGRSRTRSM